MRVTFTIDEKKLYEAMSRRGITNKSEWLQAVLNEQIELGNQDTAETSTALG